MKKLLTNNEIEMILTKKELVAKLAYESYKQGDMDFDLFEEFKAELFYEFGMDKVYKKLEVAEMDKLLSELELQGWEVLKRWNGGDGWGGSTELFVVMKGDDLVKGEYYDNALFKESRAGGRVRWFDVKNEKEVAA